MKKIYLFGNWKMNHDIKAAEVFCDDMKALLASEAPLKDCAEICVFPPFLSIAKAVQELTPLGLAVGAQNANDHASGAYTGEVAPQMVAEAGCRYVILGHSERRHIYGESSELVNLKAKACMSCGLIPVICVGETLEERMAGKTLEVVMDQLTVGIQDLPEDKPFIIAYEPVWAIGTGKTASAADAEEVCSAIKKAVKAPVLYGGSVKASNSAEIFSQPSIDGGLIGGASLKAQDFLDILKSFRDSEAPRA